MKTSTLLAILTLTAASAGNALAQEVTYEYPQPISSQKTRADVLAELRQARADGTLFISEVESQPAKKIVSTVTRAEVKAQTLAAIASGELRDLHREHSGAYPQVRRTPASSPAAGE